jgi:hypothetical protein
MRDIFDPTFFRLLFGFMVILGITLSSATIGTGLLQDTVAAPVVGQRVR